MVVGDAEVTSDLVFFNIRRVNDDNYLGILLQLKQHLQIGGRNLTQGEEKFASQWLEMGFDKEAIAIAYDRTCVNTGGFSWTYMNRILTRWHEAGLHTGEQVLKNDRKPDVPKGASGKLGQAELDAIQRILKED